MNFKNKSDLMFKPDTISVLIVDDHPQMRKAILRIIEVFGFGGAFEAGSGSEAIKILKENVVDLVICDLYLVDVSGFDVLEYIRGREINADIPVIVVTGEGSKEEIVKSVDRGANVYLLKPFKADDLQAKVLQLLNTYYSPPPTLKLVRSAERSYVAQQFRESLNLAEQALAKEPSNITARHLKALNMNKLGQSQAAVALHLDNIELNSSYYHSYAALAEIYLARKEHVLAAEYIGKELELNPRQPKRQTQLGTLQLEAGQFESAITHFREALKENVKYQFALFGMGKAYASMGNLDKAIYYYKRVRRYYPTNTKCLEAIVKCSLDAKDPKRAEFALKDERNSNKSRLDTYVVLSKFYLVTQEQDKALATVQELLLISPSHIPGLKLKAAIHMRREEFNDALSLYETVLQTEEDAEARISTADIHMRNARFDLAQSQLEQILAKHSDKSASVAVRLATCYYRTQEYRKAYYLICLIGRTTGISDQLKNMRDDCQAKMVESSNTRRLAS